MRINVLKSIVLVSLSDIKQFVTASSIVVLLLLFIAHCKRCLLNENILQREQRRVLLLRMVW